MNDVVALESRPAADQPNSVALHCIDARYQPVFDELLQEVLGENPFRLSLPGGAWWLAKAAGRTEGRFKRVVLGRLPVRDFLDSFLAGRDVRRAVLLGHGECVWYREAEPRLSAGDLIRLQGEHMVRARDEIKRWLPRLEVSGYIVQAEGDGSAGRKIF